MAIRRGRGGRGIGWLIGVAGLLLAGTARAQDIPAADLQLQNGWINTGITGNAGASMLDGIVHLKGSIGGGMPATAFTLPPPMRPATDVYVPVGFCAAHVGRLHIIPTGEVSVDDLTGVNAPCFTSLDGVAFAPSGAGFVPLSLTNGWTGAPFATSVPAAALIRGQVRLKGAMAGGTNPVAFTLPVGMRPAADTYVAVDTCSTAPGRLLIQPSGVVTVQFPATSSFSNAQCFTSLDGVAFTQSPGVGSTPLTLTNGWISTSTIYATSTPAAELVAGVVRLQGAMASGGSGVTAFVLPPEMAPAQQVFVRIGLCDGAPGRLDIFPDGSVTVEATGAFSDAQCFTSLDGVSFDPSPTFTPMSLINSWTPYFPTQPPGATMFGGIVYLRGAITNGGTSVPFILPPAMRPTNPVRIPLDSCNAALAFLITDSSGSATVAATGSFSNAACLSSLDGVSFAPSANGFTALTLTNGWTSATANPLALSSIAAAAVIDGFVHFQGAIQGGTTGLAFNLPPGMRPASDVYVMVSHCQAALGRLWIQPSGDVTVQSSTTFADAQCLTWLEGAKFALPGGNFTALPLMQGWTGSPFGTGAPAVSLFHGMVRFSGAIAGGATASAFVLPYRMRPTATVFLPLDLCDGAKGRMEVDPSGLVSIAAANGAFNNAQCFTSLDGAMFSLVAPPIVSVPVPAQGAVSTLVAVFLLLLVGSLALRRRHARNRGRAGS
jgi:hypothetical protein